MNPESEEPQGMSLKFAAKPSSTSRKQLAHGEARWGFGTWDLLLELLWVFNLQQVDLRLIGGLLGIASSWFLGGTPVEHRLKAKQQDESFHFSFSFSFCF